MIRMAEGIRSAGNQERMRDWEDRIIQLYL